MHSVTMDILIATLLEGDQAGALEEVRKLLAAGEGRQRIITDGVEAAMKRLDAKCTVEQFNLLEIMLSGRAVMGVMKELYPPEILNAPERETKATIVLGALEGDIHDLGKNILKMVLTASGYRVVDCGKDCPLSDLVDSVRQEKAQALGISGLITSIVPLVRQVRGALAEQKLGHVRVLAGGAALKQATPEDLDVDYVAQTAFDGLKYLDRMIKEAT